MNTGGIGVGARTAPTYSIGSEASGSGGAPANYVAGVGRGAMGFTTRSDIGPAREATPSSGVVPEVSFGQAPAGYVAGRGRGMGDLHREQLQQDNGDLPTEIADHADYSESNYDAFSGYSERLFAVGTYDKEDAEADNIYRQVDEQMDNRRKRNREQQLMLEQKKARYERPRIADQFADLKQQLSQVSATEWESIPDVGDHSLKLKQQRKKESYVPVPDSILLGAAAALNSSMPQGGLGSQSSIDPLSGSNSNNLGDTAMAGGLAEKLDKMSDSVTGQTVVDPRGYLTSLNSIKVNSAAEVGDIKKARLLLKSVTSTNPKHGPGWIAAARVEEFAGKIAAARKIILQGCETVPESEDVWLEAARLHAGVGSGSDTEEKKSNGAPSLSAKTILANAVMHIPSSVRIWLQAAQLESDNVGRKKAVLRRSLEVVPNSVKLWKAAIELENVNDARIMLARAVECVPHSVEMWLALAKLETHENARRVLNQAREANPTDRMTWITAAKLEEAHGSGINLIGRIIEKMIGSLIGQYQVVISRETWLQDAMDCEIAGAPLTCSAIVRNTVHLGVEEEDRRITWMDDAESCLRNNDPPRIITARTILDVALEQYPTKKALWQQAAMLEKEFGGVDAAERLELRLKTGVKHCPQAEVLWLMAAKEKWQTQNDVSAARAILLEAFNANPHSQQIWLAAVKLEWENNELVRARMLLNRARDRAPSERVWLKSALLEREVSDCKQALDLLQGAIKKYPAFAKFYLMAGQICDEELKEFGRARQFYLEGIKNCSVSIRPSAAKTATDSTDSDGSDVYLVVALWRSVILLEERLKGVIKARPTGELARAKLPFNDLIWRECIRLERRAGNIKQADALMSKAMQQCPKSGALWAEEILTCPKQLQKSRCIDALKRCIDDPLVLIAVARLFERGNRPSKARKRFDRAVTLHPKLGDAWVYYFVFEYRRRFLAPAANTVEIPLLDSTKDTMQLHRKDHSKEVEEGGGIDSVDDEHEDAEDGNAVEPSSDTADDNDQLQHAHLFQSLAHRCEQMLPNTGELWCSVTKTTSNRRKPVKELLLLAAEAVLGSKLHPSVWKSVLSDSNTADS